MEGPSTTSATAEQLRAIERWFTRRGTPHLIEDYSATEDVLTRALPLLTVVFLLECTVALDLDWPWWLNTLVAIGAFALLLGTWVGANHLRGRPRFARPARIGPGEIALFLLGPPLVVLAFGQATQAAEVLVANAALLAVTYVVTSYGLLPLTRWAAGRVFRSLGEVGELLSRALPLLLVFITFLFLTPEVWEVAGPTAWPRLGLLGGLFALLAVVFLWTRLPSETARLSGFDDVEELRALSAGTPAEPAAAAIDALPPDRPLGRRQRGNVYLVALVSQLVQLTLVALAVGLFLVAFGALAVRPDVAARWVNDTASVDPLVVFEVLGQPAAVTPALVKVAAFLAAFTAMYIAVYAVTDQAYREEFVDRVAAELRQTFAVRMAYLHLRASAETAGRDT